MSDDQVKNIFAEHAFDGENGKTVPVVIGVGEGKRQVGQATLEVGDGVVYANVVLKNDDPSEVVAFLRGGITGISIDDVAPDISEDDAQALLEFEPHRHDPVQHRDGREPWCDTCGLSIRLDQPKGRPTYFGKPDNFGFPRPSRLHSNEGEN